MPVINPFARGKYGLAIAAFVVENVSLPPEVEGAIDKRSSMAAVGNLNDYVRYQNYETESHQNSDGKEQASQVQRTCWEPAAGTVELKEASKRVERTMHAGLRTTCVPQQVPGDTQRGLRIYPTYLARTFKHILLPVWLPSYHYVGRPFQVLINGYTGKIGGRYPKNWIKIALEVIAILIIVTLLLTLTQHHRH